MRTVRIQRAAHCLGLIGIACCTLPAAAGYRASPPRTAYAWRERASACIAHRDYAGAASAFRAAADIYAHKGDAGYAKMWRTQAERYETSISLYLERPSRYADVLHYDTFRRLEPVYGAYIGAFIDREDGVAGQYTDENTQWHKDCAQFNRTMGKDHAIYFMYMAYGGKFPRSWTDHLRGAGAAAQLVLTPANLDQVFDGPYLRCLAREAKRSGIPIFLRFAGEMNGDWVPYHNDPAKYIAAFRTVAEVFHQDAPNVAMVWCVNDVPEDKITHYYPGKDAVDWVGVNFYSVPYNNGDVQQPAFWRNPADSLRFVYGTYASRHPIMIGEYAASHLCKADMRSCPDYAIDKIGELYAALPRLYPRVKAVNWLSMNTFKYAMPDRQLNDYSLLEDGRIAEQYRELIASPYFLSRVTVDNPAVAPVEIRQAANGEVLTGRVALSAVVKTYDDRPRVAYFAGKRLLRDFTTPGAYEWTLDTSTLPNGPNDLSLVAYDSAGRIAGSRHTHVIVRN